MVDKKSQVNAGAFGPGGMFEGRENVLIVSIGKVFEDYAKPLLIMATKPQNEYLIIVGSFKVQEVCEYIVKRLKLIGYDDAERKYVKGITKEGRTATAIHYYVRRIPTLRYAASSWK